MTKYKLIVSLVAFVFFANGQFTYGQNLNPAQLGEQIQGAVRKAYAASVRIWGFDAVKQMQTSGQFSGVVVSPDGHILTAAHVNLPGNTYKVMFADGTSYIAKGLGEIELAGNRSVPDVAMMKILGDFKGAYAPMGWSYSLKKDEPCISIAYPESLNQPLPTVRFGRIADLNNKFGFIQSTCIMEPGDSGGPLFDYFGRVIGLHSAIDVSESDNFEIPVDLYRKYWTALNKAETYEAYPSFSDSIGEDPLAAQIRTVPGLEHPAQFFRGRKKASASSSLLIISELNGATRTVQGALFSQDGIVDRGKYGSGNILISKSSLIGDGPVAQIKQKKIAARVLFRDKENDLVMLWLSNTQKGGITLDRLSQAALSVEESGKILISQLADGTDKVSVLGSSEISLPKMSSAGYLGVEIGLKQGWVTLTDVKQQSPAGLSDLRAGDQVLALNAVNIDTPGDFERLLHSYWPGDKIEIKVMRPDSSRSADSVLKKEVTLSEAPARQGHHPAELFAGGKSIRRDGFAAVFVHDAILRPEQCGGPVFDMNGAFYGINIARFSRTASLVVPSHRIFQFLERYKQAGQPLSVIP